MRILVVDDDPAQRETLADILSLDGHDVATADSGGAAQTAADDDDPAIAIVDLRLPDTDGLALCRELRRRRPALQTVVLTGNASVESAAAAVRAETVDYLVKPVDPDTLREVLNRAADRWRSERIEAELHRDHHRFRLLLDGLSEVVTVVSPGGIIQFESGAVVTVLGLQANTRIGTALLDWVHPEDADRARHLLATPPADGAPPDPVEVRMRDGRGGWRTLELTANAACSDPDLEGLVLTARDITDRKQLEAELRQSQKMEAIGQLTGGIAHEINNVLTVVLANGQSVVADLPTGRSESRRDLEDLMEAARHGATLVGKLLGFSRRQRLTKRTIDVGRTVEHTLRMLRRMVPESIDVTFTPSPTPCYAEADTSAIDQIIMNLVANARDAMPAGGSVTVRLDTVDLDEAFCAAHPGASPGRFVRISVEDTGAGIAPEHLEHVFEPFFTTKPHSSGTGLGMAMVYGLMKQHQGYSRIASEPGRGTTVTLYLPAVAAPAASAAPVPAADLTPTAGPAPPHATILLVEDQPALRRTGQRILLRQGFTVLTAADGLDALATLRDRTDVDLVVADVVMPNLGGKALADELQGWDAPPAILFTSGYSAEDLRKGQLLDPDLPLLRKPWTADELVASVRTTLETVRATRVDPA